MKLGKYSCELGYTFAILASLIWDFYPKLNTTSWALLIIGLLLLTNGFVNIALFEKQV